MELSKTRKKYKKAHKNKTIKRGGAAFNPLPQLSRQSRKNEALYRGRKQQKEMSEFDQFLSQQHIPLLTKRKKENVELDQLHDEMISKRQQNYQKISSFNGSKSIDTRSKYSKRIVCRNYATRNSIWLSTS